MNKDDATWLNYCYIAFAGILAFVGYKAVYTLGLQLGWTERFDAWFPMASRALALALGVGGAVWLRSSEERRAYHLSAIGEVRKVNWPSVSDTKKLTVIVVIVVTIFSIILTAFDIAWSKILQAILP